ncbi:ankyrin repeat domain-containing protein [Wolbachia endosymbiont of Ctenocephalides felis wCfeJ]|uniref:ankyrin repeat domain-containing protein n=1 Tax=Wolbachia endosymbiont of Ctenocephalides felis wCfeJ TaxID=2732594 RepID=UPI0014460EB2|nr:MAG: Actin-binding protein [Wolbachia endosymbiont of Ctenocephalides felis wCfeJ]
MSERVKKFIFEAAANRRWSIVKLAIKRDGYDVNVRNEKGHTLLHYAAVVGPIEEIDYFIEKGIDINSTSNNGSTPLHTAALYGCFPTAKYLVEKGADVNALDDSDNSPLDLASQHERHEIVEYLKGAGAETGVKAEEETESNKWVDKFRPRTDFKSLVKKQSDC